MGEMADLMLDRYLYGADDGWDDTEPREITCKRCGADELHWEEGRTRPGNRKCWVLMESNGTVHCCPEAAPATPDDFPLIESEPPK